MLHALVFQPGDSEFGVRSAYRLELFLPDCFSGIFPPHLHPTFQLISHTHTMILENARFRHAWVVGGEHATDSVDHQIAVLRV